MTNTGVVEWEINLKDDESSDIWWDAPKSKTHKDEEIPEELEKDKPSKDEIDMA